MSGRRLRGAVLLGLAWLSVSVLASTGLDGPAYEIEGLETWVTGPGGARLFTRILQPKAALYPGQRFPGLVTVPGGTGDGAPMADSPGAKALAAEGWVYVAFNLLGRGKDLPGNLRSEGETNCNGFLDQDALKAVVDHVAALPNVDAANVGLLTSSFGVSTGAGAVGRYPELPVAYFVDVEGPHDSRVICFYDAGHEVAVCGHLSLASDPSDENEAFWAEREAVRHIGSYRGRYLRFQAEIDHAQEPFYFRHAIEMINAATHSDCGGNGECLWTRMNGSDAGNPANAVYDVADPASYPTWLTGKVHPDHAGIEIEYAKEMSALAADQAPACSVTSPAEGDTVSCTVSIQVEASDDAGIAKVECHAAYQLVGEKTSPPYVFEWDSRSAANGTVPIYAVAYDTSGQSARSDTVLVSVSNPRINGYSYTVTNTSKVLLLKGEKFASGCTAYVDGEAKKTVFKDSGTVKVKNTKWKKGQTLKFKVENPGGCASYEVSFTRPQGREAVSR